MRKLLSLAGLLFACSPVYVLFLQTDTAKEVDCRVMEVVPATPVDSVTTDAIGLTCTAGNLMRVESSQIAAPHRIVLANTGFLELLEKGWAWLGIVDFFHDIGVNTKKKGEQFEKEWKEQREALIEEKMKEGFNREQAEALVKDYEKDAFRQAEGYIKAAKDGFCEAYKEHYFDFCDGLATIF